MTDWDREIDVLVVGSGASGLTAAVVAADHAADVLVVEKSAQFGGTTATSGGIVWIPNSGKGIAAGLEDSPDEAVEYIASVAGDVERERIQAFVRRAPEMLEYMEQHTPVEFNPLPYTDYHAELFGGKMGLRTHDIEPLDGRGLHDDEILAMRQTHPQITFMGVMPWNATEGGTILLQYPGWEDALRSVVYRYFADMPWRLGSHRSRYLTGGNALIGRLKMAMNDRGVPLWLESPLADLVVTDGRVVGAVVTHEGGPVRIRTRRGVILASGGFERSPQLRSQYLPNSPDPTVSVGQPDNTGDGLVIAQRAGAAVQRTDSAWWTPTVSVPGEDRARPLFTERSLPGTIMVDRSGNRFTNEAASYHVVGQAMYDRNDPDNGPAAWVIYDGAFRKKFTMGPVNPLVPDEVQAEAVTAIVRKADSIAELAALIEIDADSLQATVDHFNANAARGEDPDFKRGHQPYDNYYGDPTVTPNPNLRPLDTPPYYAIPSNPGDIGTNGGIATDGEARVIDADGVPIPGLYAAGNCSASMMGRSYPGAGATIGPAMTFGYTAALNIVREG